MPNPRRVVMLVLASITGAVTIQSCDRANDASRTDSVTLPPSSTLAVDSQRPVVSSGWDESAGPILLVAAQRPEAAIVVFPELQGEHAAAELQFDTTALRGSAVTLINRAGDVASATLGDATSPDEEEECVGWPMRRVGSSSGAPSSWSMGLLGVQLAPIPLDSAGSLSATDSSALVAEVARLASLAPLRENGTRLRGLPFSVQDVRRFRTTSGTDVVIAHLIRRVHEEANPLEERTMLIAERDSMQRHAPAPGRYAMVFHQRAVGKEETLEASELLAAFLQRKSLRPTLVLARESDGGVRYALVERSGPRTWKVKWTSALVRC